ncbi:MAG: hypothetical protein WBE35_17150 [Candidatus Cybelea sp.]
MSQSHHGLNGLHVAIKGLQPATSCPSTYSVCYVITAGTPLTDDWCVSIVSPPSCGPPRKDVYDGKVKWSNTSRVMKVSDGHNYGKIKSKWSPATSTRGHEATDTVNSQATVKSTGGVVGYDFTFQADLTTGSYAGDVLPGTIGIIVQ